MCRILRAIFAIVGLLSCLALAGYYFLEISFPFAGSIEEARLSSPNKEYDAVIIKYELMAFSTPRFELFIVPHGQEFVAGSEHFKWSQYDATSFGIEDIEWINDENLIIRRYARSRVYEFMPEYHDLRHAYETETHTEYKTVHIDLVNY